MLNRSSVIVRPKQPYLDWAAPFNDASKLMPSSVGDDRTVYLVPEYEDDLEAMKILSECFDIIFDAELANWQQDDSTWPKNRTFSMFRDWFSIDYHSIVEDLCGYELVDDEFSD